MYYEIHEAEEIKSFDSRFGTMIEYRIKVADNEGMMAQASLNQKEDTPAPMVGQRLHGYIEESTFGPKFKKTQPQDGSRTPQNTSRTSQSTSTNRDTSIERQAMVKAACELLAGQTDEADKVLELAERFVNFVQTGQVKPAPKPMNQDVSPSEIPF